MSDMKKGDVVTVMTSVGEYIARLDRAWRRRYNWFWSWCMYVCH